MARRDYEDDAREVARQRERTPRAWAMWDRLFDEMVKRGRDHRLEVALVALGARIDLGQEIGEIETKFYESIISEAA